MLQFRLVNLPPKNRFFSLRQGRPFIRAGHLQELISGLTIGKLPTISDDNAKKSKLKILKPGSIVFAKSGMSATLNRVYKLEEEAYFVSHLAAVTPFEEKLNPDFCKFFFYFFKPSILIKDSSYPSIGLSDILKIQIPVPQLSEQKRIAEILDKADTLRKKDKQLLQYYDDLAQSLFIDMFGDPVTNENGWPLRKIGEISTSKLGKMVDAKKFRGDQLCEYLGNSNVLWHKFYFEDLKEMDFTEAERIKYKLCYGDVLMCEGGEAGRCAIWKNEHEEIYFQKAIHQIKLRKDSIVPEYFIWVMFALIERNALKNYITSATISHLTGEKLKIIPIQIPPIKIQNQFATLIQNIDQQKEKLKAQMQESESLFQSLLQKAFNGGLN